MTTGHANTHMYAVVMFTYIDEQTRRRRTDRHLYIPHTEPVLDIAIKELHVASSPPYLPLLLSGSILSSMAWLRGISPLKSGNHNSRGGRQRPKKEKAVSDWHVVCAVPLFVSLLKCRLQNRHKHVRGGVELNHFHMAH